MRVLQDGGAGGPRRCSSRASGAAAIMMRPRAAVQSRCSRRLLMASKVRAMRAGWGMLLPWLSLFVFVLYELLTPSFVFIPSQPPLTAPAAPASAP